LGRKHPLKKHKSTKTIDLVRGIDKGEDIIERRKTRKTRICSSCTFGTMEEREGSREESLVV
jgi:hypothetical protein